VTASANSCFDDLLREFYHAWFRFHPEAAVTVGQSSFAGLLRPYDDDDIGALTSLLQKMHSALDELDQDELDAARYTDYLLLKSALSVECHDLQELDWRYRDPLAYVPVHAVYQLLIHPLAEVQQAIIQRLQAIPSYLRGARSLLSLMPEKIVPVWLQSAVEQCQIGSGFIRNLSRHPLLSGKIPNTGRLQPLLDDAANAMDEFRHFLQADVGHRAAGDFAVGNNRFERLLQEKHFLDVDAEAVLAFGQKLFETTESELKQQAASMQSDADLQTVLIQVKRRHPVPEQLLDTYRKRMRAAHKWLRTHDLVSLPEKECLHIQETPAFMRSLIPFVAYEPPLPIDATQRGLYYITPADDEALLAEHNHYSIDLTSVHESYPGHHLQFVTANTHHAGNLTRSLYASASLYEGWALYCEDLMQEQGFLDQAEHRLIMLRDRLWRALRVIIDVKIHTQGLSIGDAAKLLVDKLGFDQQQADSELAWYTTAPTAPLCYATGYALIKAVREYQQQQPGFELKSFHDALLGQGSIALPLVIKDAFGKDAWRYARAKVFSPNSD
jgi:uncharacterized protein (DUF885 family)